MNAASSISSSVGIIKNNVSLIAADGNPISTTPVSAPNVTIIANLVKYIIANITTQITTQSNTLTAAIADKATSPPSVINGILKSLDVTANMARNISTMLDNTTDLLAPAIIDALKNSVQFLNASNNFIISAYQNLSSPVNQLASQPANTQTLAAFNQLVGASFYTNVSGTLVNESNALAQMEIALKLAVANIVAINNLYVATNSSKAAALSSANGMINSNVGGAEGVLASLLNSLYSTNTTIINQYKNSKNSLLPYINDIAVPAARDVIGNINNITAQIIDEVNDFASKGTVIARRFYGTLFNATQRLNSYTNATVANISLALTNGIRNAIPCSVTATSKITSAIPQLQSRLNSCTGPAGSGLLTIQNAVSSALSAYQYLTLEPMPNIASCLSLYGSASAKVQLNACLAAVSIARILFYSPLFYFVCLNPFSKYPDLQDLLLTWMNYQLRLRT